MTPFPDAEAAHRDWLRKRLGDEFQAADYKRRRKKMTEGPFPFLRATYWRWCDYPLGFEDDRRVLAVGDIHVENFGTWRDVEGRLVFGVNDFDEAARMPWPHDLVRLVTSALLGAAQHDADASAVKIGRTILSGYRRGLEERSPIILDGTSGLWDTLVLTTVDAHKAFWADEDTDLKERGATPPKRYLKALRDALPSGAVPGGTYARKAGTGSLGRPRYAMMATFRGGRALREAKRLLPSAWTLREKARTPRNRTEAAALGPTRSPDAWFEVERDIAVRRLSPNNRKIEFPKKGSGVPPVPLHPEVLEAMGRDLGAMHGTRLADAAAIVSALEEGRAKPGWLASEAKRLAALVEADQAAWKASRKGSA